MQNTISRRAFLARTAACAAPLLILANSRLAFSYAANSKLSVAGIGVGGQGRSDLDSLPGSEVDIVALCDVDQNRAADTFKKFASAKPFQDFRRMLDAMEKSIDAVVVATPDHTHAVAAVACMQRKKHVYCEKPLARTVREARVMRQTATQNGVMTQMGNQGSASHHLRRAVELVWGGVIGEVREAHVWFDGGNGPMKRPTETPPVPATLNWDLWLGPAPERPYNPAYVPGTWRGWRAFGSGIVGDFGCHTGNLMFRALHLEKLWTAPPGQTPQKTSLRVQAFPSEVDQEGYPSSLRAIVEVPERDSLPPVKLTIWAKEKPSEELLLGYPRGGWGDLVVGSKGSIYSDDPWNQRYVVLPESRFENFKGGPPETLPRIGSHHKEWVDACKGNGQTFSSFAIGGPLTELMQLVNLATLVPGPIEYDTLAGRILNSPAAAELLHRPYRAGWSI
jgi:predicted dehydrogenase